MKISEAIRRIKDYHYGISFRGPIDEATSRDQVLYGDPDRELTGIVTTCYASVEVIRKAMALGANLIVAHEALFWNHGDHTDWLEDNKTFQAKKALLDEGGITVWRDHDFIHSGIPAGEGYADGIFYGFMKVMGWEDYLISDSSLKHPKFLLPRTDVRQLSKKLMEEIGLTGIKLIGNPDSPVEKVWICGHIDGHRDNDTLKTIEDEDIDTVITLECIDYTVTEYIRDCNMVGRPKTILAVGHFNTEEPGMKYMAQWLTGLFGDGVPVSFVPCADMYQFIV